MKKVLLILLVVIMVMSMNACSENGQGSTERTKETGTLTEQSGQQQSGDSAEATEGDTTWGVADTFAAWSDAGTQGYTIHFPKYTGIPEVTGLVTYQDDDTLIILDGQTRGISEPVNGVDDVFPTYFKQTVNILSVYKPVSNKDYAFEIAKTEMVEINGYNICKYAGTLTYMARKEPVSSQFIAYATQLHGNGAYIYWLVLDESADQSLGELIASHAYNMATTLREHE